MLPPRLRHRLETFWESARTIVFAFLGLAALGFAWFFLATVGPGRAVVDVPDEIRADDPVAIKLRSEIAELEKQHQTYSAANIISDSAVGVLTQAVEKQRVLVRMALRGDYSAQQDLERLEGELDSLRARRTVGEIESLVREAEEARDALHLTEADAKFREALRLQRLINSGNASPRFKNFVRETSLEQSIMSLEVLPLHREKESSLAKARTALEEERFADALTAFVAARDALDRINRNYSRTRYANLAELDRIETEIASLNAAGLAAQVDKKERDGDSFDRAGDAGLAAQHYAEALDLQRQINDRFARSRFVSSPRMETLETKLQTARSRPIAAELAVLDSSVAEDLSKRRVLAAEERLPRTLALIERLATEFPRSQALDGTLRIKLNYLTVKAPELRRIQDEVYDRLLPLIGVTDRLLLSSETPQGLYQLVMNTNPSRNPGRQMPVDSVNHADALEFCQRLSWLLGTPVRLPDAAELRIAIGEGGGDLRSSVDGRAGDTASGRANRNGYRDLLGNLAEWLHDDDPKGDDAFVFGGSYLDAPELLNTQPAERRPRTDRARHIGFRFVVQLPADRG